MPPAPRQPCWLLIVLAVAVSAATAQSISPVILNLDHASVCVSNLEPLRQAFSGIGLATDFGGAHANGVTQMALLGFDDGSYLELIAPQKPGVTEGSNWARLLAADAGTCAWASEPNDIQAEVTRLKALGVPVKGPEPGSRKRPDGLSIEWDTAEVGSGSPGSVLPFLIQDRTPRNWRTQPSESTRGSGLTGIEFAVLAVNDLDSSIALFRKTYGWTEPLVESHSEVGAKLAYFPGEPIILASPTDSRSWVGERLQKFGEGPAAFLLTAPDVSSAAKKFRLASAKPWFGQRVMWFDAKKLNGVRLGAIGQ
jgi:glyoxalase-like protein